MQIQGAGAGPTQGAAPTKGELGKNEFVKLLLAQLANQDPTAPQSSEAFVAQLAQFANVELLDDANRRLEALLVAQTGTYQTSLASLVGREVVFQSDRVEVGPAGPTGSLHASLQDDAASMTVVIKDEDGNVVRTLRLGPQAAGHVEVGWDGLDDAGQPVPEGSYTFEVTAAGPGGEPVEVEPRGRGRVTGLTFERGYPELLIGTQPLGIPDIVEVNEAG